MKEIDYIEDIRDWLKNLVEDRTLPMDIKVHEAIWQMIQSIDIKLNSLQYQFLLKELNLEEK